MTEDNLGRALAAFQRTLVAVNSPFDRYMRGETTAMVPTAAWHGAIQVRRMHQLPQWPDVLRLRGSRARGARQLEAACIGFRRQQTYAFRTPSLRNVSATAPYMHNGVFATLPEVLNFTGGSPVAGEIEAVEAPAVSICR